MRKSHHHVKPCVEVSSAQMRTLRHPLQYVGGVLTYAARRERNHFKCQQVSGARSRTSLNAGCWIAIAATGNPTKWRSSAFLVDFSIAVAIVCKPKVQRRLPVLAMARDLWRRVDALQGRRGCLGTGLLCVHNLDVLCRRPGCSRNDRQFAWHLVPGVVCRMRACLSVLYL